MGKPTIITTPLTERSIEPLRSGDAVMLSGVLYTARDAAHKRMIEAMDSGLRLPVDLRAQVLFYAGPTPARPGRLVGSVGPTTSSRMDPYTPRLLDAGLKGVVGKGARSDVVRRSMQEHGAVYFGAIGGTAALLSQTVRFAEPIAYMDLGTEAIYKLEVEQFPVIVVYDIHGGDLYAEALISYEREMRK